MTAAAFWPADEEPVFAGNAYDKYGSGHPLVKRIMAGFESAMAGLVAAVGPSSIHEVGCGEGYWVIRWHKQGLTVRGSDVSKRVIEIARENAARENVPPTLFQARSIYELEPGRDGADLMVCTEVLEHLRAPEVGLRVLQRVAESYVILSVPREPLWRVLNLARGRYVSDLGNTPGHVNHWSKKDFLRLVSEYFEVLEVKQPVPWTMVLCRPRA